MAQAFADIIDAKSPFTAQALAILDKERGTKLDADAIDALASVVAEPSTPPGDL